MSSKTNYTFGAEGYETQIVIADIPTEGALKAIFNQESLKVFVNLQSEQPNDYWPTFFSSNGGLVLTDGSPRNGAAEPVTLEKIGEGKYASKPNAPIGASIALDLSNLNKDGTIGYQGTYKFGSCQQNAKLVYVDSYDHKM